MFDATWHKKVQVSSQILNRESLVARILRGTLQHTHFSRNLSELPCASDKYFCFIYLHILIAYKSF